MSIARMVSLAGERQAQRLDLSGTIAARKTGGPVATAQAETASVPKDSAATDGAAGSAAPTNSALSSAIDKVTSFIPTEVNGTYITLVGLFAPTGLGAKWGLFAVGLILAPLFVMFNYWDAKKKTPSMVPNTMQLTILVVFALVAFTAWVAAMPGTPFLMFGSEATRFGGAAVIVLAAVMWRLASLFDIAPKR